MKTQKHNTNLINNADVKVSSSLFHILSRFSKIISRVFILSLLVFSFGFIFPEQNEMPVEGASAHDWNSKSFWYYPWGRSRVHRGLDIFAKQGTPVVAPTGGFVLFNGNVSMGGNVVLMLGPKWRFHYFAHLDETHASRFGFVDAGQKLGTVGTTGNAKGKPPHLHYSIRSLFPQVWKFKPGTIAAWNRTYYVNPDKFLRS